jgi:ubiquinone/menaquinone biosynthesis C-methylase UbiE
MTIYLNQQFNFSDKSFVSALDELPLWSGYFGSVILDRVRFSHGINILDVGCGTGFPLLEIAQRFGNSSTAYGVDPWCEALERVEQKMRAMNITNVKLFNNKAEKLPFEDNFFGLVVSNNGVNNVEDPVCVFKECFRVCKPGAQFLFTVNLPGTMTEFYTIFEEMLKENALIDKIDEMRKHIFDKRKPLEVNVSMAEQAGFVINDIFTGQFRFRYADGTAMLNHSFIKLAFMESWKNIVPPQHREDIFGRIERKLNKLAAEKGECILTIPFACFDCGKNYK